MKLNNLCQLICSLLILSSISSYANNPQTDAKAEASVLVDLEFNLFIDDLSDHDGRPKSVPLYPQASVDGHSIYLTSGCAKTELRIIDNTGHTIFSSTIQFDSEIVRLPLNISGETTIQIVRGIYIFSAEHAF